MKRFICLCLVSCFFLSGCSLFGEWVKEPVTFYYVQEDYQKDMDLVIASEVREASGHREDLPYLLALYSMGPSSEDLKSPLPRNTTIVPSDYQDDSIELTLSGNASTLTDADFTLACSCIAMTCMELADVEKITILCGDRTVTIREDNLMLNGSITSQLQEEAK